MIGPAIGDSVQSGPSLGRRCLSPTSVTRLAAATNWRPKNRRTNGCARYARRKATGYRGPKPRCRDEPPGAVVDSESLAKNPMIPPP
jgi:hypothetical protein